MRADEIGSKRENLHRPLALVLLGGREGSVGPIGPADRDGLNIESQRPKRQDLSQNEGVVDGGISAD